MDRSSKGMTAIVGVEGTLLGRKSAVAASTTRAAIAAAIVAGSRLGDDPGGI